MTPTENVQYNHGMWYVIGVQGLVYAMVGTSRDAGKFHFKAPQSGSFRAGFRRTPIELLDVREGACEREQSARVRCSEASTANRQAVVELAAAQKDRERAALAFEGRSR